jgi:uncharacterized protein (TIGR02145 family)
VSPYKDSFGTYGTNSTNGCGFKEKNGGSSGLNIPLAGGYQGGFIVRNSMGLFWTSSQTTTDNAWVHRVFSGQNDVARSDWAKDYGHSVRCVKD